MPSAKLLTLVFCLSLASTVFAQQGNGNSNGLEPRVSALENRVSALEGLPSNGGGGIGWVVMDRLDQKVGALISLGSTLEGVVELVSDDDEPFLVSVNQLGIVEYTRALYYATGNCTGETVFVDPAALYPESVGFYGAGELQRIVIIVEPGFPDSRVAYQVGNVETNQTPGSYSIFGGCYENYGSFDVLPAVPVSGDLHLEYPPPYKLVKQ